jgi:hypothetical protein
MNSIANPNWLAIAGFIHLAFAFGLALMALMRTGAGDLLQRTRSEAARRVDALFAMPFLAVGATCLLLGHLATVALSPAVVALILSAPMALLLYLGFEGLWTEQMVEESIGAAPAKPLLRLPSPAAAPAPQVAPAAPVAVVTPIAAAGQN